MSTAAPDHPSLGIVKAAFPGVRLQAAEFRGMVTLVAPATSLHGVLRLLRDHPECDYNFLADVTAVDYLGYPAATEARFAVVYCLLSHRWDRRLTVKTWLNPSAETLSNSPDPALQVESVTDIWPGAEWLEREVYDMYGIRFLNHPDLRRILLWKDFPAFPLRKDYPLRGRGEREHLHTLTRDSR